MRMNFRMDEKLPPMQRVILAATIMPIIVGEKKVKSTTTFEKIEAGEES